jgi:hypothetical protein
MIDLSSSTGDRMTNFDSSSIGGASSARIQTIIISGLPDVLQSFVHVSFARQQRDCLRSGAGTAGAVAE